MSYDSTVLAQATARFEAQREEHRLRQEAGRRALFSALPRAAEIDRALRLTASQIVAATFRGGAGLLPALEALRTENLTLQAELADLLARGGFPADALERPPLCPKCEDRGWRGAEMCDCLKALCTQEQIKALSSLLGLGEQTFDRFELDWYPDRPWPGEGQSPRENMAFIYELCLNYAQKFGRFYFQNLLFSGGPGLGKTFLSACVARVVSENGFSVVYDTAVEIFARFETQKFSRDELAQSARDETRRYLNCDLLILDDLGSELTTPFVHSALYHLVNTRLAQGRHTVISTNLSMDDLRRRYTPQVSSRLEGEYRILRFFGEDIRLLRKERL